MRIDTGKTQLNNKNDKSWKKKKTSLALPTTKLSVHLNKHNSFHWFYFHFIIFAIKFLCWCILIFSIFLSLSVARTHCFVRFSVCVFYFIYCFPLACRRHVHFSSLFFRWIQIEWTPLRRFKCVHSLSWALPATTMRNNEHKATKNGVIEQTTKYTNRDIHKIVVVIVKIYLICISFPPFSCISYQFGGQFFRYIFILNCLCVCVIGVGFGCVCAEICA